MKVIIVDDSEPDRRLCRTLLEEVSGFQYEFFDEPAATPALESCRRIAPDCVLLDYKLPDMSGLEFLKRLRADGANPDIAVVMLTGFAGEQVAVDALKAGAQDYLVKDSLTSQGLGLAVEKATEKVALIRALREERDRLAESVAEKDVLIKEVHHRVKNNLQVIASLLRLQAAKVEDPEIAEPLNESQHRVESMALIHEQLYESADLRQVDFAKNVTLLLSNLLDSYAASHRIAGAVTLPGAGANTAVVLGVDQAIPAGLILNELISNALKHAFPSGRTGTIQVGGGHRGADIELFVRDDGTGLPGDFQPDKGHSLGMQIVRVLTRQLHGTLSIERGDPGTKFSVVFPAELKKVTEPVRMHSAPGLN